MVLLVLDLSQTLAQVQSLAAHLRAGRDGRAARLAEAVRALERADADAMRRRVAEAEGRVSFLPAEPVGSPGERHPVPSLPASYCALSVDGSHIDVDRHLPVRCALVNLGGCVLTYGAHPDARFFSSPRLYSGDDLTLPDPTAEAEGTPLQGPLLGLKRSVDEVVELAARAEETPRDPSAGSGQGLPTVALIDGTLILWELGGQGPPGGRYPSYVREHFLKHREQGLLPAFDRLRALARNRRLALASYISLPNSAEVVNALRLALCAYPPEDHRAFCRHHLTALRENVEGACPCSALHDFADRDLFGRLLARGERSSLFRTRSSVVRDFYGEHAVCFFYLNVGQEIARVEVPQWAADDTGLLDLVHAVAVDQCRRGNGYPPVIQEAHEQAVVTTADRMEFRRLVEESLEGERLPSYTSQKQASKRGRWV